MSQSFKLKAVCFVTVLCLSVIFLIAQSGYAQNPPEITLLELNKPIDREILATQKHNYQISLTEGQYLNVIIEQRGIDVFIRLFGEGRKLLAEFDSEIRKQGTEKVEFTASVAGNFQLEIEPKVKKSPNGNYKILITELRPATEKDKSLQEARSLLIESRQLYRAVKYKDAISPAERALEIREKNLGSEDIAVGVVLNWLGIITSDLGDDAKAETFFNRALKIYDKQLGPDSLNAADPLNNLAVIYKDRGDYIEAEKKYQQVLAIREKALGTDHTLVASVFNNLGLLYRTRGDNEKAQQMYERSLEIRQRLFGDDSLEVALVLVNLSSLYYYKGDYVNTLKLDLRVLEIREKNLPPEHPGVATALNNLALAYSEVGEFDKAESFYQRALAIREKTSGRDNPNSLDVIGNLAKLYLEKGDLAKAEPFFQRALQIAEKQSDDNDRTAFYLNNLGSFYTLKGDYAAAEPLLKRGLAIREKILGENHFYVGRSCNSLARLYALKGDVAQAVIFQGRASQINEKNIALNLAVGTEHQKLSYMSLMSEDLNQTIALHAMTAQEDATARDQAITAILQRKGRVLDAMTGNLNALRRRFDSSDEILIDKLNDTNTQLAELSLSAPPNNSLAEYKNQIDAIQEKKNELESEISRRTGGFYAQSKPVTLNAVQAVIPGDSALVEFAVYYKLDSKIRDGKPELGERRYVVYVVRNQGEVHWAELGAAKDIDTKIDTYRQALRDPQRKDVQQLARAVGEKLMQPVRAFLGDAKHLLISPDGELNLIPFEALIDEKGNYLIENYSLTYLSSGRDLLRMQVPRESKNTPLVIANPAFGEPDSTQIAKVTKRQSITATRNLSDTYFAPLAGTIQEARSIQMLFPEAKSLTESQATESALKQLNAPKILHIATHGFFLEDNEKKNTKIENPLLRSGLALAGANQRKGENDDGILTALEATGLNLWGTKLVVLSACDTGLGEVKNGEGVYGLRRAFMLAGTESLVMSLWSVSDLVTRELMTNYYKNLKAGMGRGESLRQVQLEMLRKPNRQHPFYWASFIQSGEWQGLESKK